MGGPGEPSTDIDIGSGNTGTQRNNVRFLPRTTTFD